MALSSAPSDAPRNPPGHRRRIAWRIPLIIVAAAAGLLALWGAFEAAPGEDLVLLFVAALCAVAVVFLGQHEHRVRAADPQAAPVPWVRIALNVAGILAIVVGVVLVFYGLVLMVLIIFFPIGAMLMALGVGLVLAGLALVGVPWLPWRRLGRRRRRAA